MPSLLAFRTAVLTPVREDFVHTRANRSLLVERHDCFPEPHGRHRELAAHLPDVEAINPFDAVERREVGPQLVG